MTIPSEPAETLFNNFTLNPKLLGAVSALGFETATQVQEQVIPAVLNRQDLLVSAATGSGKTVAFLLPVLELISASTTTATRALILAPTRELAQQIAKVAEPLAAALSIKIGLLIGGEDFKKQHAHLSKGHGLIIGTPGRIQEHLELDSQALQQVNFLILDEADRMLDMGFREAVLLIAQACKNERQTLLFSATLAHPGVKKFAATILQHPQLISLQTAQHRNLAIQQQVIPCDDLKHKLSILHWLLNQEHYDKAIIFTNSKSQADSLRGPLISKKLRVGVLHGDLDQSERKKTLGFYRDGFIKILITTDVAGRGLDVNGIELVINFDMPRTGTQYVHRIGRTGRNEQTGLAVSLVNATEWNLMASIERYLKQSFERRIIPELKGTFNGPKKVKASGKAVGNKQKLTTVKKEPVKKPKLRQRAIKNIGKRRTPSNNVNLNEDASD